MRLVVITGGGESLLERVKLALGAGAEVLVREPALPEGLPLDRVILHARMPGAADVASALHLSSDMDVAAWRKRFAGPISVSAHTPEEAAQQRALGADSVFLSPIFSARHGRPARGVAGIAGCIALGGILPQHVAVCARSGAVGIAVLGGIWGVPIREMASTVGEYRRRLDFAAALVPTGLSDG